MSILKVARMGHPVLRERGRPLEKADFRSPLVQTLIDDMIETMHEYSGVGLAAPQVGVLRAVIIVDAGDRLIELINPQLVEARGKEIKAEGCLSIPDKAGDVERPVWVKVKGLNRKGEEVEVTGEGLTARALCHELDHLEGILFIDRVIEESR